MLQTRIRPRARFSVVATQADVGRCPLMIAGLRSRTRQTKTARPTVNNAKYRFVVVTCCCSWSLRLRRRRSSATSSSDPTTTTRNFPGLRPSSTGIPSRLRTFGFRDVLSGPKPTTVAVAAGAAATRAGLGVFCASARPTALACPSAHIPEFRFSDPATKIAVRKNTGPFPDSPSRLGRCFDVNAISV